MDLFNIFVIFALVGLAGLVWLWLRKPALKGARPRTWPAAHGKLAAKSRLAPPP